MKRRFINSLLLFAFIFTSIIYLEILFKIRVLTINFDLNLLRALIFSLSYSLLMMFFTMFFKEKAVKRIMFALTVIITLLYVNQEIYSSFVEGFYSVTVAGDFTLGLSFLNDYILSFRFGHLFYILPTLSLYLLTKFKFLSFNIEYCTLKQPLVVLMLGFLTFFISLQTIDESVEESNSTVTYSEMDLYTYMYNSQDALKKFGLLTYTQRDFFSLFRNDPLSELEYEVLLDDYFENKQPHLTNSYSNLFSNKNLILIMAESLDTFAINEELTPTLYRLKNENAYFENFYSPLYYRSTADSEFLTQTSLYPDNNVTLSMDAYMDNTFKYTLPKMFSEKGYDTYSFHDYIDYFYPRAQFHTKALGYDAYYGAYELDLVDEPYDGGLIFDHQWESDLEMMEKALPYFIETDNFFANFVTVSGHFRYDEDHPIAQKNADIVEEYEITNDIDLPKDIFYYLAANIELDKALEYLFDELDRTNHLQDTVVMIYGDHYAYGIDRDTIWEYDDMKDDGSDMDIHNVPMIVYSSSTLLSGTMDNYMSTIDIMPTISNLFDLNFDYTKVFGIDALENENHTVRFADMSFSSEHFSYDSLSERYFVEEGYVIEEEDLLGIYHKIVNDYMYNLLVLQYDYFKEDEISTE